MQDLGVVATVTGTEVIGTEYSDVDLCQFKTFLAANAFPNFVNP